MSTPSQPDLCLRALTHYTSIEGVPIGPLVAAPPSGLLGPLGDGLINETYLLTLPSPTGGPSVRAVLQRVNPIFDRIVHEDIEAVTAHLQAHGMVTPRLYRTAHDDLSVDLGPDGVWRLMTFIPGRTHSVMTPALARSAGALVGRFHATLTRLHHRFHFSRPGAHNLAGHLQRLRAAVETAGRSDFHPREAPVPPEFFPLAQALLGHSQNIPGGQAGMGTLPLRMCHGDLKVSNLRFDDAGEGVCLLDLDTLAYLPLAYELGDALRSWCNPVGEDVFDGRFNLEIFEEALRGYADPARVFLTQVERQMVLGGVERITFQLAVRFAVDVVSQNYFRWNPARFPSRAAHNLMRATGQWNLLRSLIDVRPQAEEIARRALR